ncbi:hypothetical protein RHA1_ro07008 [Rhodococcus jostii RHA1]|uniref:Uncharacterized protein n=1 Tax=Rhodococcus jostii (strain RHA1) TaxID=101510 RepID=Q0S112_RHOJR|nr:hypothetical protein RHA1_ro07008 [Rhodococcus jostii RHA1]
MLRDRHFCYFEQSSNSLLTTCPIEGVRGAILRQTQQCRRYCRGDIRGAAVDDNRCRVVKYFKALRRCFPCEFPGDVQRKIGEREVQRRAPPHHPLGAGGGPVQSARVYPCRAARHHRSSARHQGRLLLPFPIQPRPRPTTAVPIARHDRRAHSKRSSNCPTRSPTTVGGDPMICAASRLVLDLGAHPSLTFWPGAQHGHSPQ